MSKQGEITYGNQTLVFEYVRQDESFSHEFGIEPRGCFIITELDVFAIIDGDFVDITTCVSEDKKEKMKNAIIKHLSERVNEGAA